MKKLIISVFLLGSTTCATQAQSYFSPYVPQVDVNLYREVLTSKQNAYEKNFQDMQELIDDLGDYVNELYKLNPERGKKFDATIGKYIQSLKDSRPDLSDNTVSYQIKSTLREYIKLTKQAIKEEY